ncbi:DUF4277 domain-containing protein [Microcystis sp.]|uniref:DUF4277 domain-containing protein n=1 Tax=Microcystis sp. TaxID=1127 RepID=UPI0039198669
MSDTPLIKGGLRGDRHPPYQGGQGGSNLKSIFNLIITSYLYLFSQFFKDKEIEELLGEEIKTDYINDDIIGRVMDEFRIVE